jgi:hypothetical protein
VSALLLRKAIFRKIVVIFFIWGLLNFLISVLAPFFVPYLGFFSYADKMSKYGMPYFIQSLTNFDGIFYIRIATQGYSFPEQAYFPMYPTLINLFTILTKNPIISGVLISYLAFVTALYLLHKLLKKNLKIKNIFWVYIFLLVYPTSYYFGVMYTESLFFMLLIATIYLFKQEKFLLAFLFGYLTALTRVSGIFLTIPLGLIFLEKLLKERKFSYQTILFDNGKYFLVICAPVLGLLSYTLYLYQTTGDPLYFIHAQEHFGAHRSAHLIFLPQVFYRYLKIFLTADKNFQYLVALVEVIFFSFTLFILILDLLKIRISKPLNYSRLGLNLFSFANILLPTLTGTLTAIPRYSLLSLSVLLYLAELKNKNLKILLVILMLILHILFYAFFTQGYYVT